MIRTTYQIGLSFILLITLLLQAASAQDWTRFRGPNGTGVSNAKSIPTSWTEKDYNWKMELPGRGHSSPVVWKEKMFLTSADLKAKERYLLCYDVRTGKELWKKTWPYTLYKVHKQNGHATSTPAVDDKFVYVLWQSRSENFLEAVSHEGESKWKIELGSHKSPQGPATSPIVFAETVLLANDHDGESFLLAVDRMTGKERWKIPRSGDRTCYATPCIHLTETRAPEAIFVHCYQGIWGVDLETGKKNWEIDVFGRFKQRACASPVLAGDLVIGVSGFTTAEKNVVAVRPTQNENKVSVQEVYRITKQAPHIPTPVVFNNRLFLWTDRGIVSSFDVLNGKLIWQKRVGGNFSGSPICVNGVLYAISQEGDVVVISTSDEYQLLSKISLGELSRSTPAVSGGVMFLRTESHLYSLGGSP